MFGNSFEGGRQLKPEAKPVEPSFDQLVAALPPEKGKRLRELENLPEELSQTEFEDGSYEIEPEHLTKGENAVLEEYYALITEARRLLGNSVFGHGPDSKE
ncbi:MAG: hypothetical protein HGA38_04930 [Candidatus Moranbacteria bacterium]|nr:hypothetical protein [Candidatus Moranbacteria bacterium]